MKKLPALAIGALILMALSVLPGCVPAVRLGSPDLPKAETRIGSVAVGTIHNSRPQNAGGHGFGIIGAVRSFGSSFPLHTEEGRELNVAIREAVENALAHTGYYALAPAIPGDVPRLDIDVISFWGDGVEKREIEAKIMATLVETGSGTALARKEIALRRGFALTAGNRSLQQSFAALMKELQQELAAFMQSEAFRMAVRRK